MSGIRLPTARCWAMNRAGIPAGRRRPEEINVICEIPQGGLVKCEFDPESGALFVDRFLRTTMIHPASYLA